MRTKLEQKDAVRFRHSGTLMHEVLHKKSVGGGFTHGQMINALVSIGLNPGADRRLGHDNTGISDALASICF